MLGVISDTHGLLRPEAMDALQGVDAIVHAGDVGQAIILEQLAAVAPVVAVRGNVDRGALADRLPEWETVEANGALLHVLHNLADLDLDLRAASIRVVISGHSHQPSIREQGGVMYLNPGSAGPRRFKLPLSVARVEIDLDRTITVKLIELRV